MTAKFLDHNRHGELKQWRRRRQRKRQRSNQFRLAKQQRYTSITLFVHSGPSLHDCGRKLPIFTRPLYGVGEHSAKFSFFFFYQIRSFWIQPQTRILQTFDKLNEIEWEKFETVPIHFFKWCCRFVIIQAPVFQKLDNAILHCINHHPADTAIGFPNTHPLDSDLSGG